MMESKDWILLFVPIICNGIIIFVFQKILGRKIERQGKRQDIRDDVLKGFWNKLQELNDVFVRFGASMCNPNTVVNCLGIFQNKISEIIQYYDTNKFDLDLFSQGFDDFQKSWMEFQDTYIGYRGNELTQEMQEQLGEKLQIAKEKNQELINEVRKKY